MASKLTIQTRLTIFNSLIILLVIGVISGVVLFRINRKIKKDQENIENFKDQLFKNHIARSKEIVDIAYSFIKNNYENYLTGEISLQEAQRRSKEEVKNLRYGADGYFWINDTKIPVTMIMHATNSALDGTKLLNPAYNCASKDYNKDGTLNLFEAMVEVCRDSKQKEGYVYYLWPKPNQSKDIKRNPPKISYVKEFTPWGWIVGTGTYVDDIEDYIKKQAEEESKFQGDFIFFLTLMVVIVFGLSIILGIILAYSIAQPVLKINTDISESSRNLENASYQISDSSQMLSSGSSRLASSIEEITSSLEELQSVIESNTKNINQSELMMKETNQSTKEVTGKMNELQVSLGEINENSQKIVNIIKVIDDIAFQTNILALNAAVEAARAGDAGRGFAVVADQVKNLAQKSAGAAKETAELIDRAIDSVYKGEVLGKAVSEVQHSTGEMTEKVSKLLDEINRASKEQMKGINQITQAVSSTNSVVQQTASSAEETAASGQELLSQSEKLRGIVDTLSLIVKGKKAFHGSRSSTGSQAPKKEKIVKQEEKIILDRELETEPEPPAPPAPIEEKKFTPPTKQLGSSDGIELIRPEDKIPLDDFDDF